MMWPSVAVLITFISIGRLYVQAMDLRQQLLQQNKPGPNPYLDEFLDAHLQPKIKWDGKDFSLVMDDRFQFEPMIRTDTFPSIGEPWPMPKHYISQEDKVVLLANQGFRINILNKSCDILEEAVKRYMYIVLERSLEEPYSFYFNYNEKTAAHRRAQEDLKYQQVSEMESLDVYVTGDDNKYPHVDMDESYNLTVQAGKSRLEANEVWGALRGLETFSQLVFRKRGTDEHYARETIISDSPRFPHRGILVDTSRHFIEKKVLQEVIEGMSYNKLNTLHWHIVDDNSFPYQSEVFPNLSAKGAFHPTLVYSLKDIKELVEFARLRGVRVVPEFDTPGHMMSWLGHPEIKADCYAASGHKIDGPIGPINPASNTTYEFMRKLFMEIYQVFPDVFVHLGGDELHSNCWATNPEIVEFLDKNGVPKAEKSSGQNYINKAIGYYFNRLLDTLKNASIEAGRNASFIMWEDVYKNTQQIQKDSIMEVWYGQPTNVRMYNQAGYRALFSSCWYLDNYKHGVSWQTYYACEPSPYSTDEEEKGKLLGGEACLWAEYITSDTLMTFMWPRASAPAERLWSPRTVREVDKAARRINEQRCRMIYRGLTTGHSSGPDYCLRYNKGVNMGGARDDYEDSVGAGRLRDLSGEPKSTPKSSLAVLQNRNISLTVLKEYHDYLPCFNFVLSALGALLLWKAYTFMRRKNGNGNGRKK